MDISETYIKMCEKASSDYCPNWIWKQGDFAYSFFFNQVGVVEETAQYFRTKTLSLPLLDGSDYDRIIPLPRQDQLQEMLDDRFSNRYKWVLAEKFSHFAKPNNLGERVFDMTMEQLWLAFVMKEKYDKVWNGEDWIPAKVEVT